MSGNVIKILGVNGTDFPFTEQELAQIEPLRLAAILALDEKTKLVAVEMEQARMSIEKNLFCALSIILEGFWPIGG